MADRIRLLVTTSDFVGRGAERELSNLLAWLPRDRFDIHLCLWRDVFDYPRPTDIPITILEKHRAWDVFRTIRRFSDLVASWHPDVVFSQLNYVNTVTGTALGKRFPNVRWIARMAGNPDVEIRFPVLGWARRALRRADAVTGCSQGACQSIVRHLRIAPERVHMLPNVVDIAGVDRQALEESPVIHPWNRFVYVHAGRMVPQKDHQTLLRAFSMLPGRDSELWLLGTGPLAGSHRQLARRLGIEDRVRWLGFLANPHPVFRLADAMVLSSRYEGLPNVVIEGMLCGRPVVSTDCPYGPAELIDDGRTGYLVPVGEPEALAGRMDQLRWDESMARKMGQAARESILNRFAPEHVVPAYTDLFERIIS